MISELQREPAPARVPAVPVPAVPVPADPVPASTVPAPPAAGRIQVPTFAAAPRSDVLAEGPGFTRLRLDGAPRADATLAPQGAEARRPARATPQAAPAPAVLGPEHQRLAAMAGTYDVELSLWLDPAAPPIQTRGTATLSPILGGLFVEERIDGELAGQPFQTRAWTGFNTSTQRYEATRISSTNTLRINEAGAWDAARGVFELIAVYPFNGETWRQRTVIRPEGDTMHVEVFMGFGDGPDFKGCTIDYRRRAP